jgi:hypothetical protein
LIRRAGDHWGRRVVGGDSRSVCKTAQSAGDDMSRVQGIPHFGLERSLMDVRRDFTTERIRRVETQLSAARRQVSLLVPTDRRRAAQLRDELDDMLKELLGPTEADRQRNP